MNIKSFKLASFIIARTNKKYKKINNEIIIEDINIDEFEKQRELFFLSQERKILNIYVELKRKKDDGILKKIKWC